MAQAPALLMHSSSTYTRVHNGVPLKITQLVGTRGNTVQQVQTTISGANGLCAAQVYTGYSTMDQAWHTVYDDELLLVDWPVLANNGYTTAQATAHANHQQYLQFALDQVAKSVQAYYGGS